MKAVSLFLLCLASITSPGQQFKISGADTATRAVTEYQDCTRLPSKID